MEGGRKRKIILDNSTFQKFFKNNDDFERNIFDWLRFDKTKDLLEAPALFYKDN